MGGRGGRREREKTIEGQVGRKPRKGGGKKNKRQEEPERKGIGF